MEQKIIKRTMNSKQKIKGKKIGLNKSLKLQEHAKAIIPGMSQLLSKRPDMFTWGVWPGYYSRAKGTKVWDLDNKEYIDMSIGGIGATVLGYADPDVDGAVIEAIRKGVASSLNCPEEVALADLLCDIHPWADMVRFTRCGGESMAVAIRIARASSGRDKVAFCGYHGWHDWYLAANLGTENALGEHLISGLNPVGVPRALKGTALPFRYNHIEELEKIIRKHGREIGVVVMEPLRNDPPKDGFLHKVRDLTHKIGAVLVFDEVSAGFRLNSGGVHLTLGVDPDMAVFSKAIGNGYAIGAVIGRGQVMEAAQSTFISSTNWTERVGFAAGLATIRKFQAVNAAKHLVRIGEAVQKVWKDQGKKHGLPLHIGGMTPVSHFTFDTKEPLSAKALFVQNMLEHGILATTAFYAMYAHSDDDVAVYEKAVDKSFAAVKKSLEAGMLRNDLRGQPSRAGFRRLI